MSRAPKVNTGRRAPVAPDSSTVGLVGALRSRGGCDTCSAAAAVGKAMTKRMTSVAVATKVVVTLPARRGRNVVSVDKRGPLPGERESRRFQR